MICDDIRQEMNGKFILIGIYGKAIVPNALPARLGLSLWLELEDVRAGNHEVQMHIVCDAGEALINADMSIESSDDDGYGALPFRLPPIEFKQSGIYRLEWKLAESAEWDILRQFEIRAKEQPMPAP